MTARYKLLEHIKWPLLHGQRVKIEVSDNYVIAVLKDGSFQVLAQSIKVRGKKVSNADDPGELVLDGMPTASKLYPEGLEREPGDDDR